MSLEDLPRCPAPVLCVCGDPQSLHRFGNGVCLRVRRGSPCDCQKFAEPVPEIEAPEGGRVSLVDQWTVKP